MKNLAFQTEINRFKWLQVALNIVFNSLGILAAGAMISLTTIGNGTVPLDLIITNLLLIFFIYTGARGEMIKWRAKNCNETFGLNASDRVKSFASMGAFKGYLILLMGISVCITLPMWFALITVYGSEVPKMHMLAYKEVYAVVLAYALSVFGGRVGGLADIPSKLVAQKKASA